MINCIKCDGVFEPPTKGRTSKVCPDCYPKYRKAVNLFCAARGRAKKKNLEFDLDFDWVYNNITRYCPMTNLPFQFYNNGNNYSNRHALTPSIDKIDPGKGYTKDNCRIVIWWYNAAKQQYSDLDIWHLCDMVASFSPVNDVLNAQTREETDMAIT